MQGLIRVGLWPGVSSEARRRIWAGYGELTGLRDLLCFGEAPPRLVGSVKEKRPIFDCAKWTVSSRRRQYFEPSEEVTFIQRVVKKDQHGLQMVFFELEDGGWISDRDTPSSGAALISCQPKMAATAPPFAARMAMLITNLVGTQASPSNALDHAAAEIEEEIETMVRRKALDIITRTNAVTTSNIKALRANGAEQFDAQTEQVKNDLEQLVAVIERTSKPVEQLTQLLVLLGELDTKELMRNLMDRVIGVIDDSVSDQFVRVHTAFQTRAGVVRQRLALTFESARPALKRGVSEWLKKCEACKKATTATLEHVTSLTWRDFQQTVENSEDALHLAPLTAALDKFEALARPPTLRLSSVYADVLEEHVMPDGRLDSSLGTAALIMTGAVPGLPTSLSTASLDETLVSGCEWLRDVLSGKATGIDAMVDLLNSIWQDVYRELERASKIDATPIEYLQRAVESLDGPVLMLCYASAVARVANDPSNIANALAERVQQGFNAAHEYAQGLVRKLSVSFFKESKNAFRKYLDAQLTMLEQQLCAAAPVLQEAAGSVFSWGDLVSQTRGSSASLVSTLGALKKFGGPLMFRVQVTPELLRSSVSSDDALSQDTLVRLMKDTLGASVPPGPLHVVTVNGMPFNSGGSLEELTMSAHIEVEVEGPSITSVVNQTMRILSVIERNSTGLAHVATTAHDASNLLKSTLDGFSSMTDAIDTEITTMESDLVKTLRQTLVDGTSTVFQAARDRVLAYFDEQCDRAEKMMGHVEKTMENELDQVAQNAKQAVEKAKKAGNTIGPNLDTGLYKAHAMLLGVQNDLRECIGTDAEANQVESVMKCVKKQNGKVRALPSICELLCASDLTPAPNGRYSRFSNIFARSAMALFISRWRVLLF